MAKQSVGVLLTPEAWRRMSRAVHGYENAPVSPAGRRRVDNRAPVVPIVRAKVTTAITTGTFDSPSSAGRALIRRGPNGARLDDAAGVVVWNDYPLTASIPVGRTVRLCWIAGEWWLLTTACS